MKAPWPGSGVQDGQDVQDVCSGTGAAALREKISEALPLIILLESAFKFLHPPSHDSIRGTLFKLGAADAGVLGIYEY